ncbi:hypothetical protein EMIT0P176_40105 [Pseudomonas sp. IT-P176]
MTSGNKRLLYGFKINPGNKTFLQGPGTFNLLAIGSARLNAIMATVMSPFRLDNGSHHPGSARLWPRYLLASARRAFRMPGPCACRKQED